MFVVQLVPSGGRWKSSMDVTVVVELASRILDKLNTSTNIYHVYKLNQMLTTSTKLIC